MFTKDTISTLVNQAMNIAIEKFKSKYYQEAEVILNYLLKVSPDHKDALHMLGLLRQYSNQFESAIEIFKKIIEKHEDAEAYNNLGFCYSNLGNYEAGIAAIQKAVNLKPDKAILHNNLGLLYRNIQEYDKSIECFQKSLELEESEFTWDMMGGCYGEKRDLVKAEKCFRRAIILNPDFAASHVNLASVYHFRGEWKKAWPEYEWRKKLFEQIMLWENLYGSEKSWAGESLEGKTLLVHVEQGHGDAIHFFRYVKRLSGRVIVHCSEDLAGLFGEHVEICTGNPSVIKREELPDHDYHCSILSLPHLLDGAIPNEPYLETNRTINLDNYSNSFKVGIVWAGSPQHPNDASRSCRLSMFRGIHDIPGVKLFSLVKDVRPRMYRFHKEPVDLTHGTEDMRVVDMSAEMSTFKDTAAIINSLDLVIAVDTAVLHLAGAMGRPAWALLSWDCDWRWSQTGSTSVWYPSVRIFRQPTKGNWDAVFSQVEKEIKNEQRIVGGKK